MAVDFEETKKIAWKTIEEYFGSVQSFGSLDSTGIAGRGGDDTAFFQNAANNTIDGGVVFVPPPASGSYTVTSPIIIDQTANFKRVSFVGVGRASKIVANFAGAVFKTQSVGTSAQWYFDKLNIVNSHALGEALRLEGAIGGAIENCFLSGGLTGLNLASNSFTFLVKNCAFLGISHGGNGLISSGHTDIVNCDFVGWGTGIRGYGASVSVKGCRLEVNVTAMALGLTEAGTTSQLSRSLIGGNSLEANDIGIDIYDATGCEFAGTGMQGSANAPSGQSQIGIRVRSASGTKFSACGAGGTFDDAAIILLGGSDNAYVMDTVIATNAFGGNAKTWDVRTGLGTGDGSVTFNNCNYTPRHDDTVTYPMLQRHGMVQYLSAVSYLDGNVAGRNLRGKNIALGNGVTSKAVAFTGAHGPGASAINTLTAANTGGATLAAGTYFYLATSVTTHGESPGTAEQSATIAGADNSAVVSFFGMTADGFKRRIYRGTATGVYDGYFEHTLNSNANFTDIGQAFDGLKSPPTPGVDDTSMIEPDANYAVVLTPSWGTTTFVTSKATTGFTANFGTATPDALQTFDWVLVR